MHLFISESESHRWTSGSRLNTFVYLQRVWESSLDVWIKAQCIRLSQESLKVIVGRLDQGSMHLFISESESHRWTSGSRLNTFVYLKRVWESSLDVWIKAQCIRLSPKSLGVIVGRLNQGSMRSFICKVWESSLDVWIKAQCILLSPKSLGVIVGRLDQGSMHSFISKESGSHRWTSESRLNAFIYLQKVWESSLDVWIKAQCILLSPKSLGVIVGRLDQGSMHSFISRE